MKTAIDFETKLVIYGALLREYHEVQALCEADFWKDKKLSARLDAIAAKLDKVYGPMITAMNRLAKEMA